MGGKCTTTTLTLHWWPWCGYFFASLYLLFKPFRINWYVFADTDKSGSVENPAYVAWEVSFTRNDEDDNRDYLNLVAESGLKYVICSITPWIYCWQYMRLYIGSQRAQDVKLLKGHSITHVLSMTGFINPAIQKVTSNLHINYLQYPLIVGIAAFQMRSHKDHRHHQLQHQTTLWTDQHHHWRCHLQWWYYLSILVRCWWVILTQW